MKQWEYWFDSQKPNGVFLEGKAVEELLRLRGLQGWELCAIDYACFIFKREKEPT